MKKKSSLSGAVSKGFSGLLENAEDAVRWGKKIGDEAIDVIGVAATEAKKKLGKVAERVGRLGQ